VTTDDSTALSFLQALVDGEVQTTGESRC